MCPNCSAPLTDQAGRRYWSCAYCHSLIAVPAEGGAAATVEKTISDAGIAPVKALLAEGNRAEAVAAYQRLAGVSPEDAAAVIETMMRQYAYGVVTRQPLNDWGIGFLALCALALPLSLIAWAQRMVHPVIGLAVAVFALLNLLAFSRAIVTMLRYWSAPSAKAVVQRSTEISKTPIGRRIVHTLKVLVEVRPTEGASFQDSLIVALRAENLEKIREGSTIWVKYRPGVAGSLLVYDLRK